MSNFPEVQTIQERMKAKLEQIPLPKKAIRVYGRQVTVTCYSRTAAERWAAVIGAFAKVKSVVQTVEEAKENKGTVLRPTMVKVWRVWGTI